MRRPSFSIPILIAALLALGLIIYVFAGGRGKAEARPHCASAETLSAVKREIFARAGTLRGGTDATFARLATDSVLHPASTLVRKLSARNDEVACSGTLALDLPPGVAAADGRHSLSAQLSFRLRQGREGMVQLEGVTNADGIASPLAAVSQAPPSAPPQPPASAPQTLPSTTTGQAPPSAPAAPAPPLSTPQQAAPPAKQPPPEQPQPAARARANDERAEVPKPVSTTKPTTSAAPRAEPPPHEPVRQAPPPPAPAPAPVTASTPSFNCRHAHSRGEMAVCSNPALSRLDREMAQQFHRAVARANAGERTMLKRTGRRFIHYRDSCPSTACMADAYRGRMREIDDIMNGPW